MLLTRPRLVFGVQRDGMLVPLALSMSAQDTALGFVVQSLRGNPEEAFCLFSTSSLSVVGMSVTAAAFFDVSFSCHFSLCFAPTPHA